MRQAQAWLIYRTVLSSAAVQACAANLWWFESRPCGEPLPQNQKTKEENNRMMSEKMQFDDERIVAEAQDAFWAKVAEHVPEATTGDLPPDAVCLWDENCKATEKTDANELG